MLQSLFEFTTESEKDGNWEIKSMKKMEKRDRETVENIGEEERWGKEGERG